MDFNGYVSQGIEFFQKEDYESAIKNLKAAQKLQPDNVEIQGIIGMIEEKLNLGAQHSQALANEARHRAEAMGIEDVDKAIVEYADDLKRNPNDASAKGRLATAYYIRGVTFSSKREYVRAIADYSEAIKYEPDYALAINKRGQAYSDSGDFSKAIADFMELLRLNPDDHRAEEFLANAYMARGIEHDKKGESEKAVEDWKRVLDYQPDDATAKELIEMAKKG